MDQNRFTNQILAVTDKISTASPDDRLWTLITQRLQQQKFVPAKTLWLAAASIAILLAINIAAIRSSRPGSETQTARSLETIVSQNNELY